MLWSIYNHTEGGTEFIQIGPPSIVRHPSSDQREPPKVVWTIPAGRGRSLISSYSQHLGFPVSIVWRYAAGHPRPFTASWHKDIIFGGGGLVWFLSNSSQVVNYKSVLCQVPSFMWESGDAFGSTWEELISLRASGWREMAELTYFRDTLA